MALVVSSDGRCTLQSEELAVVVLPKEGGRIASLRSLSSGLEFLAQTHRDGALIELGMDALFRNGQCAGIEECLPTVAPCGPDTEGGPTPDHGDFWQIDWTVLERGDEQLAMEAHGFSRTLRFRKDLTVHGNTLRVAYFVTNVGDEPQSFLYACHPLFAVRAGDRIVLPDEVRTLRLDYSRRERLGQRGAHLAWPTPQPGISLDKVLDEDAGTADMFYTERLHTGVCSVQRAATGQTLEVLFPVEMLPYLGIWLCYGGWPDDTAENLQYAVALEPTTSPFNSLTEAQEAGAAITLSPGSTYSFDIAFRVSATKT